MESALEAASLHPAQLLGLEKLKGTLDFGADAGQGPRWGGLGSLKIQEFLGGLGQGQGGQKGGISPTSRQPHPATSLGLAPLPQQARLLTSETRLGRGLLDPYSFLPLPESRFQGLSQSVLGQGILSCTSCVPGFGFPTCLGLGWEGQPRPCLPLTVHL